MPSGEAGDFGQRVVHALDIEGRPPAEEGVLVAEVAVLRTPAGDDDRIRDEVLAARDEIAANLRHARQRSPARRAVHRGRATRSVISQELSERLFAGSEKEG